MIQNDFIFQVEEFCLPTRVQYDIQKGVRREVRKTYAINDTP
jgi:hypothetical protein